MNSASSLIVLILLGVMVRGLYNVAKLWLFSMRRERNVSNYKSTWKEFYPNWSFWREALVGKKIMKVDFADGQISKIYLSSGEELLIGSGEALSINDGQKPYQFWPKKNLAKILSLMR